jgi:hypothetical protein
VGDEPPKEGETFEVTVELEGEVSKEAFDEYRRRLRECVERLASLTDAPKGGKKLRVRRIRWALVRQPPRPLPGSGSGA